MINLQFGCKIGKARIPQKKKRIIAWTFKQEFEKISTQYIQEICYRFLFLLAYSRDR